MEYWSSPFINGDSSSGFIYPFQNPDNFSGNQENKCFSSGTLVQTQGGPLHEHYYTPPAMVERIYGEASNSFNGYEQKKKKKMTTEQIKLLERNFREDMKLDSDRKMNLCKELGLQPRQIAVWFQNRKARWKTKQLEHLYESLRQEFAVVSREKKLLQEELIQLKSMMRESGSSEKQQTWEKACSEAISAQFQFN